MSLKTKRKSYKVLIEERESILDEVYTYKHGNSFHYRMGLWDKSTYLDELMYMRQIIEKEIELHEILFKMKLYNKLEEKIPLDIIFEISSFGDNIDMSAVYFNNKGIPAKINKVEKTY
jgi:hypothetical protein